VFGTSPKNCSNQEGPTVSEPVLLPPDMPLLPDGARLGGWWHATDEPGRIVCDLCPRACAVRPGDKGFCFVRENRDGQMVLTTYGRSTGFCIDPIEKKPLNHFYPGTSVLSFGTAGCNLGCKFCQNWSISKSREIERLSETASPAAVAIAASELDCKSVAFTYNDPVIWAEYAIDAAKECRARGVKTVAVTAGYITPAARGAFYEYMDAANVDLKGFTEEFYQKLTLSHLKPVLETLRWLKHETNVWFEITNLMIPRANDSPDEVRQMCDWVLEAIGPDVPIHFTAFHPDFRLMDREGTPPETLLMAYDIAVKAGLHYVYVGNILANQHQSTFCPQCKKLLIERRGYEIRTYALRGNACQFCGTTIPGHFDPAPGNWGSRRLPVRISNFEPARDEPAKAPLMQISPSHQEPQAGVSLSSEQQRSVLNAAARTLAERVNQHPSTIVAPDDLAGAASLPVFGAFVTVKRQGKLRSCCGTMGPKMTLADAVRHAAERTADDDPRFPPLSPSELAYLDMDVWVLFNPQPMSVRGMARREAVIIGKHGLIVERGENRGLLLPGVATEHGFDAETFLTHTCLKANLPAVAWREDETRISTFEGLAIESPLGELFADLFPTGIPEGSVFPIEPHDVPRLAELARTNILALATGATPSYYAPGVGDGNVHGLIVGVVNADGLEWLQSSKFSARDKFPLQSTLFSLCEGLAQTLRRQSIPARDLASIGIEIAVLNDPAMHGTVAEADLRGYLPVERALTVQERNKVALVFRTDRCKDDILVEAADLAEITTTNPASVNSFAILTNAPHVRMVRVPRATTGPSVRPPAVAGTFYPAEPGELSRLVDRCLAGDPVERRSCPAVMVPHAGLIYSGRLAADVLRRVEIPETVIVIGPKHTRHGVEWAVAPHDVWQIPGAAIPSDQELARRLCAAIDGLKLDAAAHAQEHGVEVELPFLARLAPQSKVVGIAIGGGDLSRCREFASGLADVVRGMQNAPLLVISSDMNHFATDDETRILDEMALSAFETLDPEKLYSTVIDNRISMCGILPAVIVLETLRLLGQVSRIERIGYATSGDVSGDRERVVGYAGLHLL
jgi:AmmeMemoRadiSam system radical SAM enzyme/AmmeMemoRadiSam system protein B/AmmeMemoRadiSam system protein A